MIILAGSVIISLTNSGIIGKANEAVEESNLKEVQQLASLAWSEAYIAKMENSGIDLKQEVLKSLASNEIDTTKYNIEVTESGVTVTLTTGDSVTDDTVVEKVWRIERTTNATGLVTQVVVTNGTETYNVGSTINYMPDGVGATSYTGGWKLLGVDDEGRLLIMSANNITEDQITFSGQEGYLNALTTLQTSVNGYMDGTFGLAVRSITMADVDNVIGYDKTKYSFIEYMEKMGINTSSWDEETKNEYKIADYGRNVSFFVGTFY